MLRAVQAKARAEGLWAPQAPKEYGGMALPVVGWAAMYEEANRSIFGPLAFNCAAPDDGNMNTVARGNAGAEGQKKWLRPIVEGKVRSIAAMTEPSPGGVRSGRLIRTRAQKQNSTWVIHGHKWFMPAIADHFILVARTSDDARRGLTAFLYHRDQPGWRILRRIPIMGPEEHGGHCELLFEGLEVPEENVLMQVGDDCAPPRSGSARHGLPIACAGSASPSARWRSRKPTWRSAKASGCGSPTARAMQTKLGEVARASRPDGSW